MTASTLDTERGDDFPVGAERWAQLHHDAEMRYRGMVAREAIHAGIAARHAHDATARANFIASGRSFAEMIRQASDALSGMADFFAAGGGDAEVEVSIAEHDLQLDADPEVNP
jgi:hypothetical protein